MNKQNGSTLVVVGIVLTLLFVPVLWGITQYVSAYNYANKAEQGIIAEYKNNKNILGQYSAKIVEMAQVPEMQKNDIKEIISANMSGRYGKDGSKAQWQWIKENNLSVSPELYNRLQQTMEAGRNKFENGQTALLSKCQEYQTQSGYLVRGFFIGVAGYPKIDVDKTCKPIESSHSQKSFEDGVDNGIKLGA